MFNWNYCYLHFQAPQRAQILYSTRVHWHCNHSPPTYKSRMKLKKENRKTLKKKRYTFSASLLTNPPNASHFARKHKLYLLRNFKIRSVIFFYFGTAILRAKHLSEVAEKFMVKVLCSNRFFISGLSILGTGGKMSTTSQISSFFFVHFCVQNRTASLANCK